MVMGMKKGGGSLYRGSSSQANLLAQLAVGGHAVHQSQSRIHPARTRSNTDQEEDSHSVSLYRTLSLCLSLLLGGLLQS